MRHKAGEEVECVVTYLAMEERPGFPHPRLPLGPAAALLASEAPPAWYFLSLYDAVGSELEWTDQHERPRSELEAYLRDGNVVLYTFLRAGWPHGFFLLDGREPGVCDIAYFGLVPEALGKGLGTFLLEAAVHTAWDRPGIARVTVNTNSLDHPRALPLYQKAGFVPERREIRRRVLTRDRMLFEI